MKIIANYESGSKCYGLNNSLSDNDISFLFLNDSISTIIGLDKHSHQNKINDTVDSQGYELRHFLNLLRKGNTQSLEMLNNQVWVSKTPEFDFIQENKQKLYDSKTIYKCFRAYSYSERNLIFGRAHIGRIGQKRKDAIQKYGYSYRNASHAVRLLSSGISFFRDDYFPVNVSEHASEYGDLMKGIKFTPEKYDPLDLEQKLIKMESELDKVFEARKINYTYNENFANEICYYLYMPLLKELKTK